MIHARPRRAVRALAALALLAAACGQGGDGPAGDGTPVSGGTVVISAAAEPASLLPTLARTPAQLALIDQLFDRLADVGDSLQTVGEAGFRPRLARSWRWSADSLSIAFQLHPDARWHDGRPVTARDVRFSFDLAVDPAVDSPLAPLLANLDSVSAPDSLTAVFWYKRRTPQQLFDATYPLYVVPEHLLAGVPRARLASAPFGRAPVGSGRFRFEEWTPGERITLAADPDNYRTRARLDQVVWRIAPDLGSATIRLIAGDADFFEAMRAEYLGQTSSARNVRLVPYPSLDYGFLQFNLRAADGSGAPHPLFADPAVRRALSMAVDRERIVRNVFDSLAHVAVGPVPRALFPDWPRIRQLPHDHARARALLDSAGWLATGPGGERARAGVPLAFTILVPTSSTVRDRMATQVADQLRAVGARVAVERLEIGPFLDRQRARRFDAAMGGWRTDPNPSGIRQTWGTLGARARGGSNYGSYESPAFDAQVDSALTTLDAARARTHWLRAYQTIVDDAPAIWLFEPRLVAGAHRRIRLERLRADGWWLGLADWWIPAAERIGRDRVGGR